MKSDIPQSPEPFPREKIDPDLLAWVKQTLDMDEVMREIRELEKDGGLQFEDFFDEIKAIAMQP